MKHYFLFFIFIFTHWVGLAAVISSNGTGGGDWAAGTTWVGGAVPVDGDDITIAAGDVVRIDGTPDITLADVAITIDGTLNMDNDGLFTVGNLILTGTSGLSISNTGTITESVSALEEGLTTITLNGVTIWTACSNPVCVAIVNAILDPEPELNAIDTNIPPTNPILLPATNNPLPVEMLFFTARRTNESVLLQWATVTEIANSHFEIERSVDAQNFEKIDEVEGNGNAQQRIDYDYNDIDVPVTAFNLYYRLKQVDFDGAFEYSRTVKARSGELDLFNLRIWPNPFQTSISLTLNATSNQELHIKIFNLNGLQVYSQQNKVYRGLNDLDINRLSGLKPGPYFLILSGNTFIINRKIIKSP